MIEATIEVPRCWAALVALPDFDTLPEFPQSEKIEHAVDDPRPFYDEWRAVTVLLADGNEFTLNLMSGQNGYFLGYEVNGSECYEESEPFHTLSDDMLLDTIPGYRVRVRLR